MRDRSVSIPISMPLSLLENIDKARGSKNRSAFITEIVKQNLYEIVEDNRA